MKKMFIIEVDEKIGVVYFWKATGGTNVLDALAETAIGCAVLADPTPVAAIKRTVKRIGAK